MPTRLSFKYLLTPGGLRAGQTLVVGSNGIIDAIESGGRGSHGFFALPGMPNAHSHAFQRALSGFGEQAGGQDSFWSWREAMYRLAARITPQDMQVIARQAFGEMLRAGFTSVAEFHYLHQLPGSRFGLEMAQAVIEAARAAGIHLVLLPVFYQQGGFNTPPAEHQQRFVHASIEDYCRLLQELHDVPLGIAPHSLRAVPPQTLARLLVQADAAIGGRRPIHIHISEQRREVEECQAAFGSTPIELLARTVELDARWNLVHATHASKAERDLIVQRDATVVLCPLTEAGLGDGLFAAEEYAHAGGRFAIGSDSNCRIDAVEELRLLEYGQRLRQQQRARLADASGLGVPLWQRACRGGAAALGEALGELVPGKRADLVVLDEQSAPWLGHGPDTLLDALLVGGSRHDIAAVYVGGERVVDHGAIAGEEAGAREFAATVARLNQP
ncbi:MAG TPA: formimidoylglutamate deiminase [Gammaproteobacteria bacterium]|nr:formimidoylglutamate deiminase [Gammaproteobacteria bacterium]